MTPVASAVPGVVVGAVLFAALLHASWNALIKARSDPFLATVMLAAGSGLVGFLVLPFVAAPLAPSWPFIAGSSLIHALYCALLVEAYRNADMSHAYPLMRGSAPLSLLGGAISLSSYTIALWAMTLAPVPVVAALRETSILFATVIAAVFLREQIRPARLAAVLLVACGAALVRLA